MLRVADQQRLVADRHLVRREDRGEGRDEPGLPVDERAVAVEREGIETTVVEGHGNLR